MSQYKQEFDDLAKLASEATLTLGELVKKLKKREMERVFMAIMEYPVPNTKQLIRQEEIEAARVGVGLKEMQMKLAVLNMAMAQEEDESESEDN